MTVREYLNTATDAEIATHITGFVEAVIEEYYEKDVPFNKLLAIFAALQDTLSSEMHEGEAEFNKRNSMLMAVTAANFRLLSGSEQNDAESEDC